jgi:PAS domain S-box-containing protein
MAAGAGAFLLWILSGPALTNANRCLGMALSTGFSLAAALALGRSASRPGMDAAGRRGVRWIAASQALCAAGTLYGLFAYLRDPLDASRFNLADVFYVASYPAVMVGILAAPRSDRPSASRARILVDVALFLAGIGLPLWHFTVLPGLSSESRFDAALCVAYPVASFTGISILNFVLLTRRPLGSRGAFILLISAVFIWWLADLLYLLDTVPSLIPRGRINWSNAASALSVVLFLIAAGRIDACGARAAKAVRTAAASPLPFLTVITVGGWLLLYAASGRVPAESTVGFMSYLALLFVILSVRELFVFRDSRRWLKVEVDRESRARFEMLVSHCSDVIMLVDAGGTVRFSSPAALGSLGASPHELEGRPLISLVHPDDASGGREFLDGIGGSSEGRSGLRWRLRHTDGTYRTFDAAGGEGVQDPAGAGRVVTLRDVSEQVGLEEKLRQTEKLEAVGQLVGGIAHNFNNILTSTMMRLGFIREHSQLPVNVLREIEGLQQEANRSAELTRKLVMFGRQQRLSMRLVDLRDLLKRLQPAIHELLGNGIQLYVTGGGTAEVVLADTDLIDYVVMNLSENARDAMPNGGCLIIELTSIAAVDLAPDPDGAPLPHAAVRMSFQDTGRGMEAQVLSRLFEPFFTTKGVGGLGLGLASVHGAVKQHHGWIRVESSPGLGSTFRVFLPKAQDPFLL